MVRFGLVSEVAASSIHFANINSAKDVWWLDIPLAKLDSAESQKIGLLLCDNKSDQLYYLEVPKSYLKGNLSV